MPLREWLMETQDIHKELGLFYVAFLTVPLYIQWYQFIILQITLPTLSHQLPSNFMVVFKRLHLNLLSIVTLLNLKVVLGYHLTRLKNIDYIKIKKFKVNPHRDNNIFFPTVCALSKQNLSQLIHQHFGHVSITRLKQMEEKGLMEGLPENIPELEEPCPICIMTKANKIPRVPTTDVSKFAPGFMLHMYFAFSNVEIICRFTSTFVATF